MNRNITLVVKRLFGGLLEKQNIRVLFEKEDECFEKNIFMGFHKKYHHSGKYDEFCDLPIKLLKLAKILLSLGKEKKNQKEYAIYSSRYLELEKMRENLEHRYQENLLSGEKTLLKALNDKVSFKDFKGKIDAKIDNYIQNETEYEDENNKKEELIEFRNSWFIEKGQEFEDVYNNYSSSIIDSQKAMINILVVDDFYSFHINQMIDIETKYIYARHNNKIIPFIHFDFECIPSRVEKRLKKKRYDLIIHDVDFWDLPIEGSLLAAKKEKIPVILYSKFQKVKHYKTYVGGFDGLIPKHDSDTKSISLKALEIFDTILKELIMEYDMDFFSYQDQLIIYSHKLKRFGFFNEVDEEIRENIKAIPISSVQREKLMKERLFLDLEDDENDEDEQNNSKNNEHNDISSMSLWEKKYLNSKEYRILDYMKSKIHKDYLMIFYPLKTRNKLKIAVIGKVPHFIETQKYLPVILSRIQDYGFSYDEARSKIIIYSKDNELNTNNHKENENEIKEQKCEYLELNLNLCSNLIQNNYNKNEINTKPPVFSEEDDSLLWELITGLQQDLEYIVVPKFSPMSLLDIVGPVTIGPSSSHTAGANRMARLVRNFIIALFEKDRIKDQIDLEVEMVNSFNSTGEGHGSHLAVAAGLLGLYQYSEKLPLCLKKPHGKISKDQNKEYNIVNEDYSNSQEKRIILINTEKGSCKIKVNYKWNKDYEPDLHNNSIKFIISSTEEDKYECVLQSIGGGNIQLKSIENSTKHLEINDKEKSKFSKKELEKDDTFLNGKDPIKVKGKFKNIEQEIEIDSIFNITGETKKEIEKIEKEIEIDKKNEDKLKKLNIIIEKPIDKIDQKIKEIIQVLLNEKEPIEIKLKESGEVLKIDVNGKSSKLYEIIKKIEEVVKEKEIEQGTKVQIKNINFKIEELTKREDKEYDILEPFYFTLLKDNEVIKRPDFLTLDDLISLSKQAQVSLFDIARSYEKWIWYFNTSMKDNKKNKEESKKEDKTVNKTVKDDFLYEVFKNYRKLMLDTVDAGIKTGRSNTTYNKSWASKYFYNTSLNDINNLTSRAVIYSMGVNEINAKMIKPILAAPTAGACGIVPGVMKALDDYLSAKHLPDEKREKIEIEGLVIAALVGLTIANIVPTAGATHGCQAETGTGSAMAAAMATHILGGDAESIVHASAIALKNSLGSTCDPLEGKVEIPCIKRSGMRAGEALEAALMSINGVRSEISPSDVVRAMKEIGENMMDIYKETSKGGLALTRRRKYSWRCLG